MVDWSTSSPRHTAKWKRGIAAFVIGIVILQSHPIKASRRPDFLGCYQHETDKWQFAWGPPDKVNYTITNCFRECEKNGFEKAGLMNGYMCRCTNKPLGAVSQFCDVQCYETWESICGGKNSLSVYRAPKDAKDSRYIGCWSRNGGPVLEELPDSQVATTDLTSCIANCRKNSEQDSVDRLVAALNKTHCVCGFELNDKSQPAEVEACVAGSESEQLFDIYTPDCPEGTYGKICLPCQCSGDEVCDLATGSCPGACADGWLKDPVACSKVCEPGTYGNQCSQQCFCEDSKACDPQTGSCPTQSCMPGFTGSTCSQECANGFFGFNCSETCKCLNGTDCNHVDGTCPDDLCLAGWTGPDCQSKVIMAITEAEVLSPEQSASSWGTHAAGGGAGGFIVLLVVFVAVLCFM